MIRTRAGTAAASEHRQLPRPLLHQQASEDSLRPRVPAEASEPSEPSEHRPLPQPLLRQQVSEVLQLRPRAQAEALEFLEEASEQRPLPQPLLHQQASELLQLRPQARAEALASEHRPLLQPLLRQGRGFIFRSHLLLPRPLLVAVLLPPLASARPHPRQLVLVLLLAVELGSVPHRL